MSNYDRCGSSHSATRSISQNKIQLRPFNNPTGPGDYDVRRSFESTGNGYKLSSFKNLPSFSFPQAFYSSKEEISQDRLASIKTSSNKDNK